MSSVSLLRRALVAVALSSLLAVSCTEIKVQKPRAFGREKEILVICNDTTWAAIEEQLRLKVEVEFQAVRREKIFELAHANQQDVDYFKEWDKIILIESLERKILLPDVVDEATLKKVAESREGLYFTKPDIWARGQSVVGLAAAAEADLPRVVALYGDRIYQGFLKILEQEEDEKMYLSGINQALADAQALGLTGKATTPYLLGRVNELTGGHSLAANIALVKHNARLAAAIAVAWATDAAGDQPKV